MALIIMAKYIIRLAFFDCLVKHICNEILHLLHPFADVGAMDFGVWIALFLHPFVGHLANDSCLALKVRKSERKTASVGFKLLVIIKYF